MATKNTGIQLAIGPLFANQATLINNQVIGGLPPSNRSLYPTTPRDIRSRLDTLAARRILDLGYTRTLLAQVFGEQLVIFGDDFKSFTDLMAAVQHTEQILSIGQKDTFNTYFKQQLRQLSTKEIITPTNKVSHHHLSPETTINDFTPTTISCKSCHSDSSTFIILPCSHFCLCQSCSNKN